MAAALEIEAGQAVPVGVALQRPEVLERKHLGEDAGSR